MVLASLVFTVMTATAKVAREELDAVQVVCWRTLLSLPFALAHSWAPGFKVQNPKGMIARSVLGFVAMVCFFTAAKGLSLANLSLLSELKPLLIAVIAPIALGAGERSSLSIWGSLFAGLVGCAVIIGPDLSIGSTFALWALASTVFSSGAHVSVRSLGHDDARTVVFWFHATAAVLGITTYAILHHTLLPLPPMHLWAPLLVCGVAATYGQLLMTRAYAEDKASVVAAASYAGPLFGVAMDLIAFGTAPTVWTTLGGTLVIAAGLRALLSRSHRKGDEP